MHIEPSFRNHKNTGFRKKFGVFLTFLEKMSVSKIQWG
jgi:hypothetical protein